MHQQQNVGTLRTFSLLLMPAAAECLDVSNTCCLFVLLWGTSSLLRFVARGTCLALEPGLGTSMSPSLASLPKPCSCSDRITAFKVMPAAAVAAADLLSPQPPHLCQEHVGLVLRVCCFLRNTLGNQVFIELKKLPWPTRLAHSGGVS